MDVESDHTGAEDEMEVSSNGDIIRQTTKALPSTTKDIIKTIDTSKLLTHKSIYVKPNTQIIFIKPKSDIKDTQTIKIFNNDKQLKEMDIDGFKVKFDKYRPNSNDVSITEEVSEAQTKDAVNSSAQNEEQDPSSNGDNKDESNPQIICIKSSPRNNAQTVKLVNSNKEVQVVPMHYLGKSGNDPPSYIQRIKPKPIRCKYIGKINVDPKNSDLIAAQHNLYNEISNEKRQSLIRHIEFENMTVRDAAELLNINLNSANKLVTLYQTQGLMDKGPRSSCNKRLSDEEEAKVRAMLRDDCTLTLGAIKKYVLQEFGKDVSIPTLSQYNDFFRYSVKLLNSQEVRPMTSIDVRERRHYAAEYLKLLNNKRRVYFLDVAEVNIVMKPYFVPLGSANTRAPKSHMMKARNVIVLASLSEDSLRYDINRQLLCGQMIEDHLNKVLSSIRKNGYTDCVFIMDYSKFRNYDNVTDLLALHGHHVRYFPPYSVDLNPVQLLFSQWSDLIRSQQPQTERDIFAAMETIRMRISAEQCGAYVARTTEKCQQSPDT